MQTKTDADLIVEYTETGSDDAFTEIVRRYALFVYSAAFRQVGSRELARDVAQSVFSDLARKAPTLGSNTVLIGWLHKAARLSALHQQRIERRRGDREQHAMEWHESNPGSPEQNGDLAQMLDEALSHLRQRDREALLVRFFKDQSYCAVGATLGISEAAAHKRVSRSLEKLRTFFSRRGVTTTIAAVSAAVAATAQPTPDLAIQTIATNALAAAKLAAAPGSASFMTKIITPKFAISTLLVCGTVATLALREREHSKEMATAHALAQSAADEAEQLRAGNAALSAETNKIAELRSQADEVLKLRAEVARLRRAQKTVTGTTALLSQVTNSDAANPSITISSQFLSVSTDQLNGVPWNRIKPGELSVMQPDERTAELKLLNALPSTELLSSPRVETGNGIEAMLFTGQMLPIDGTNVPVGITLSVNPHFSLKSPTVDLDLQAQVNLSKSTTPDASQLNMTAITNTVTLLDGESVILRKDIEPGLHLAGSTNDAPAANTLIVLLTPRINKDRAR